MKPTDEEVERLAREMCRISGREPDERIEDWVGRGTPEGFAWDVFWREPAQAYLLARAAERSLALGELAKADGELIASMTAEDAAGEAEIARSIRSSKPWYPDDDPRWQEFTPGDPMPCDPDMVVEVLHFERQGQAWSREPAPARYWLSEELGGDYPVVAWRPA